MASEMVDKYFAVFLTRRAVDAKENLGRLIFDLRINQLLATLAGQCLIQQTNLQTNNTT